MADNLANGILLPVDCPLLQSGKNLRKCHPCGICPQCLPGLYMQLIFHRTQLHALQLVGTCDRHNAVSKNAESIFPPGKPLQAELVQPRQNTPSGLPVEAYVIDLIRIQEKIRRIKEIKVLIHICDRACGGNRYINVSDLGS